MDDTGHKAILGGYTLYKHIAECLWAAQRLMWVVDVSDDMQEIIWEFEELRYHMMALQSMLYGEGENFGCNHGDFEE